MKRPPATPGDRFFCARRSPPQRETGRNATTPTPRNSRNAPERNAKRHIQDGKTARFRKQNGTSYSPKRHISQRQKGQAIAQRDHTGRQATGAQPFAIAHPWLPYLRPRALNFAQTAFSRAFHALRPTRCASIAFSFFNLNRPLKAKTISLCQRADWLPTL